MKKSKITHLINKIPIYIVVILIIPIAFNYAFSRIVDINHNHYEMIEELGKIEMVEHLMKTLEIEVWDLSDYDIAEKLWQIQVIQIVLTIMQQLVSTLFVLFALSMSIFYLTRRRIHFSNLFRYSVIGLLTGGFFVLVPKTMNPIVFIGSLILASLITGLLSYNELKMSIIKDYFGEENINNGVY